MFAALGRVTGHVAATGQTAQAWRVGGSRPLHEASLLAAWGPRQESPAR